MQRTLKLAMAGLSIGGATTLLSATPASADLASCDPGEVCLFENNNYNDGNTNHLHQWVGDAYDYKQYVWYNADTRQWSSDGMNDETSSIKNNGNSCDIRIHQHHGYDGADTLIPRGDIDPYLANNDIGDNRATSHEWVNCA